MLLSVHTLCMYLHHVAVAVGQTLVRDVTIQLFWIHDSIQIQTKCLDSIQIQFFKMLIASKLNSRFNSTINISSQFSSQFNSALQTSFQINSQFNSFERWTWCFLTNITSRPLSPFLLGILYYVYSWRQNHNHNAVKFGQSLQIECKCVFEDENTQ